MIISQLKFLEAVNKFKKYLDVEKGYSKLTIKEYENDLQQLYRYLKEELDFPEEFKPEDVDRLDIAEFLADAVIVNDNKAITRNRKLFAIRSFYKYLLRYGVIEKTLLKRLTAVKPILNLSPFILN